MQQRVLPISRRPNFVTLVFHSCGINHKDGLQNGGYDEIDECRLISPCPMTNMAPLLFLPRRVAFFKPGGFENGGRYPPRSLI